MIHDHQQMTASYRRSTVQGAYVGNDHSETLTMLLLPNCNAYHILANKKYIVHVDGEANVLLHEEDHMVEKECL